MEMIKHKRLGLGEVISKASKGNSTYLTVRFASGKGMQFVIPESFETGLIEAEGNLKAEVDKAIEDKKARETAKFSTTLAPTTVSHRKSTARKTTKYRVGKIIPIGPVASAYVDYLIAAGYKTETDSGKPSTVYAYVKAVLAVLSEEDISWLTLKTNASDVVKKYDIGGEKEILGRKSNKTVINALKRFEEFVNAA